MLELAHKISELAIQAIAMEWKAQGHNLTGKAIDEIETVIKININNMTIQGFVLDYMAINNQGVPSDRIPYTPNSGKKESEYIKGLIKYAKMRMGASDKQAKSIAFAIASKHKQEGMPTKNSVIKYSKTGRRTGFIEIALDKIQPQLLQLINDAVKETITFTVMSYYKSILNR